MEILITWVQGSHFNAVLREGQMLGRKGTVVKDLRHSGLIYMAWCNNLCLRTRLAAQSSLHCGLGLLASKQFQWSERQCPSTSTCFNLGFLKQARPGTTEQRAMGCRTSLAGLVTWLSSISLQCVCSASAHRWQETNCSSSSLLPQHFHAYVQAPSHLHPCCNTAGAHALVDYDGCGDCSHDCACDPNTGHTWHLTFDCGRSSFPTPA